MFCYTHYAHLAPPAEAHELQTHNAMVQLLIRHYLANYSYRATLARTMHIYTAVDLQAELDTIQLNAKRHAYTLEEDTWCILF